MSEREIITVELDPETWLRGDDDSYLLRRDDQKMCCVGFWALALGFTDDELENVPAVSELDRREVFTEACPAPAPNGPSLYDRMSPLYRVNDDGYESEKHHELMTDARRVELLNSEATINALPVRFKLKGAA